MVLQAKRPLTMSNHFRRSNIFGCSLDFRVMMYQNAIVKYCDPAGRVERAVLLELRGDKDDIVRLPFTGRPACVNQGNGLLVN